jgi:uncharacterized coiled-coil protein SlyX
VSDDFEMLNAAGIDGYVARLEARVAELEQALKEMSHEKSELQAEVERLREANLTLAKHREQSRSGVRVEGGARVPPSMRKDSGEGEVRRKWTLGDWVDLTSGGRFYFLRPRSIRARIHWWLRVK